MRIRRSAARLLGSASYSAPAAAVPGAAAPFELLTTPPPPQLLVPCSAPPESHAGGGFASPPTASGEPCELSRSPWDLIAELSISDPQVEDDLVDKYFVSVTCRASWLSSGSMPAASVKEKLAVGAVDEDSTARPRHDGQNGMVVNKKKAKKGSKPKKKAKVKKEEDEDRKPAVYKFKKHKGKRWHCGRPVSTPNSLCDYHFYLERAYVDPDFAAVAAAEAKAELEPEKKAPPSATASKPATSSKPRKKKPGHDLAATEGFYYYAGFGPFRSKRQCRSGGMNEPVPAKQEEEDEPAEDGSATNQKAQTVADDFNKVAAHDDVSSFDDIAGITGGDEESSDDDYGLCASGRNVRGEHRADNCDGKRKNGWKRGRKPVKARSLKSLM